MLHDGLCMGHQYEDEGSFHLLWSRRNQMLVKFWLLSCMTETLSTVDERCKHLSDAVSFSFLMRGLVSDPDMLVMNQVEVNNNQESEGDKSVVKHEDH